MDSQPADSGSTAPLVLSLADPEARFREAYGLGNDETLKPDRRGGHTEDSISVMVQWKDHPIPSEAKKMYNQAGEEGRVIPATWENFGPTSRTVYKRVPVDLDGVPEDDPRAILHSGQSNKMVYVEGNFDLLPLEKILSVARCVQQHKQYPSVKTLIFFLCTTFDACKAHVELLDPNEEFSYPRGNKLPLWVQQQMQQSL